TRHGSTATSIRVILFGLANVMLGVELEPELGDEIELGLEIIDMLFLVVHELLEQVARHVVLDGVAVRCGFLVKGARRHLRRKIAVALPSRSVRCEADRAPACWESRRGR